MNKLTYMLDLVFLKNTRRYTPIVCIKQEAQSRGLTIKNPIHGWDGE